MLLTTFSWQAFVLSILPLRIIFLLSLPSSPVYFYIMFPPLELISTTDNFLKFWLLPSPFIHKVFCATNYFCCRLLQIISPIEYYPFEALSVSIIYFSDIQFPVIFQYFSSEYFLARTLFSLILWSLILILYMYWYFNITSNFLLQHISHESGVFPSQYFFCQVVFSSWFFLLHCFLLLSSHFPDSIHLFFLKKMLLQLLIFCCCYSCCESDFLL